VSLFQRKETKKTLLYLALFSLLSCWFLNGKKWREKIEIAKNIQIYGRRRPSSEQKYKQFAVKAERSNRARKTRFSKPMRGISCRSKFCARNSKKKKKKALKTQQNNRKKNEKIMLLLHLCLVLTSVFSFVCLLIGLSYYLAFFLSISLH